MAKYNDIAQDLLKRIEKHEFNTKLPTEEQLIEQYQVSRNTIRNAINWLIKNNVIYPIQGSGIFIRPPKRKGTMSLNNTHGITVDNPQHNIHSDVLTLNLIEADEELSEFLKCEINTPIYYIERLRYKDQIPFAIEYTYYNKDIIPYIDKEIAENSIYRYITENLKLTFGFTDKYINAIKLNEKQAHLLKLEPDDPAIEIEDHVYLNNGQLFNSSRIVYNYLNAHFYISSI